MLRPANTVAFGCDTVTPGRSALMRWMTRWESLFQRDRARIFRRVVAWGTVVVRSVVVAGTGVVVLAAIVPPPSAPSPSEEMGAEDSRSRGCLTCHRGLEPMHASTAVRVG